MDPTYKIRLPIFSGPMDLLLHLVQKNELEITQISIAKITKEYLDYLHLLSAPGGLNLELSSEFLLMAATLLRIKMRSLLPSPLDTDIEDEEDPAIELARRLEEYRRFKDVALWLREKETSARNYFPHSPPLLEGEEKKKDRIMEEGEVSLGDLLSTFKTILERNHSIEVYEISPISVTVEEKIDVILNLLREKGSLSFFQLFERASRQIEMIVTFLALLELIRLRKILVRQMRAFGEIWIREAGRRKESSE
ncbi:segregation/condensation protein A [candidate division TA06 bacterium]|nr:segregation/condensation protein A [candidate division TA06 bacterium]